MDSLPVSFSFPIFNHLATSQNWKKEKKKKKKPWSLPFTKNFEIDWKRKDRCECTTNNPLGQPGECGTLWLHSDGSSYFIHKNKHTQNTKEFVFSKILHVKFGSWEISTQKCKFLLCNSLCEIWCLNFSTGQWSVSTLLHDWKFCL